MRVMQRLQSGVVLVLGVTVFLASCDQPTSHEEAPPTELAAALAALDIDERPHYRYEGEPQYVDIDTTRIVVGARAASLADIVGAASAAGLSVESTRDISHAAEGHVILHLASNTSRQMNDVARARLRTDSRFQFVAPGFVWPATGSRITFLNRVVVKFHDETSESQVDSLLRAWGLTIERSPLRYVPYEKYWLAYPPGSDALQVAAALDQHPLVEWAAPDKIGDRRQTGFPWTPSDIYFANGSQYYLKNTITKFRIPVDINVDSAWGVTKGTYSGSNAVTVAIIDAGIDGGHPEAWRQHCGAGFDAYPGNPDGPWNPYQEPGESPRQLMWPKGRAKVAVWV